MAEAAHTKEKGPLVTADAMNIPQPVTGISS